MQVLPSFFNALCGRQHPIVTYEVVLSLRRLVRKYHAVLVMEWYLIRDMLALLRPWLDHDALMPGRDRICEVASLRALVAPVPGANCSVPCR